MFKQDWWYPWSSCMGIGGRPLTSWMCPILMRSWQALESLCVESNGCYSNCKSLWIWSSVCLGINADLLMLSSQLAQGVNTCIRRTYVSWYLDTKDSVVYGFPIASLCPWNVESALAINMEQCRPANYSEWLHVCSSYIVEGVQTRMTISCWPSKGLAGLLPLFLPRS